MGKKKTKGMPPPEEQKFKDLLRRLVDVPRKELEEKIAEHKARKGAR